MTRFPERGEILSKQPDSRFATVLAGITLIAPLSIHFFLPIMPAIKVELGMSDALAETTFSITLCTMAVMTLIYGNLSDRYGRRPVLLCGLSLFVVGSTATAFAISVPTLLAGRLVQALGAGCGVTLARAIARDAYGPERLVKAIAYLTMAYALGPMIAPPLGGVLLDNFGWRTVFFVAALAGVGIGIAAYFIVFETNANRQSISSSRIVGNYLALLRQPRFLAFVLQSGFSSGAFFTMAAASSFLMRDYLGRSATEFGVYFLLFPLGYVFGNFLSSRLSRVPIETMVLAGSLLLLVTEIGQAALIFIHYFTPMVIFIPGFLISVAQGLALPNAQAGAIRVAPHLAGTAAGIGVFLQMLCGGVFSQIYGLLADGTPTPMIVSVGISTILLTAAGLFVFATRPRPRAELAEA